MRVADYIFQTLADWGVKNVFFVSGGGAMFLDDALGKEKRIQYVCCMHEQGAAIAAEGYARISNQPGVACVTTGPGGTNALTGVAGAWLDSIPMLVVSGQIKNATCIKSYPHLNLRQLGDQELNIVDVVKPITKYAAMVSRKEDVRYCLERAWHLAKAGRPGPVWLDVPLDVQSAEIDPNQLRSYNPAEDDVDLSPSEKDMQTALARLADAKRPVIVAGIGVTLSDSRKEFLQMAEKLGVPVLTTISGIDLIPSDHPLFFGRPGILGERPANFILQNSDYVLVLGTRMCLRIIGYAFESVARAAYKVMVDVDDAELNKPTFQPDLKIHADAGRFIRRVLASNASIGDLSDWLAYCNNVKRKYPVVTDEHRNRTDYVSSYAFPELVGQNLAAGDIVVTGNGTAYTSTFQAIPLKPGVRMFSNQACASMGYDLPAAMGAAFAGSDRRVVLFTGDGSIQMNVQEMQTILNYRLPIKVFMYNNDGYLSIKNTQRAFFEGRFVGSNPESGVVLPDMKKIAAAYGWKVYQIKNNQEAAALVPEILAQPGAVFCEVMTDPYEALGPKSASKQMPDGSIVSQPLENLAPFLPEEEFRENMLIPPVQNFTDYFFDLDGTTLDTYDDLRSCMKGALEKNGQDVDRFDAEFVIGPPLEVSVRTFLPNLDDQTIKNICEEFKTLYDSSDYPGTVPYPGMIELINRLHKAGKRIFIVTNKRSFPTFRLLDKFGLRDVVTEVVTPDSRPEGFTKPEMLKMLLYKHNIDPAKAIMTGDMVSDVLAGKSAGVHTIAVTWGYGSEDALKESQPDKLISSVDDFWL